MKGIFAAIFWTAILSTIAVAAPASGLNDASVRNFVAMQARFWNARDFARFYATFAPQAAIVTVHRGHHGGSPRSTRTLAEDRHAAEKFFAASHANIRESDRIEHIAINPGARRATVRVRETTVVAAHGKVKVLHAVTEQELAWQAGRIVSLGLTEWDER